MPLSQARPGSADPDRRDAPSVRIQSRRLLLRARREARGVARVCRLARSTVARIVWRHPMSVVATLALVLLLGLIVMPVPAVSESGVEPPVSSPPPPGAQTLSDATPAIASGGTVYALVVDA